MSQQRSLAGKKQLTSRMTSIARVSKGKRVELSARNRMETVRSRQVGDEITETRKRLSRAAVSQLDSTS